MAFQTESTGICLEVQGKEGDAKESLSICEYVQLTQSVSGIRFASSVYPEGTNVVIFEPALMHCVDVKDYNIGDLDINETAV